MAITLDNLDISLQRVRVNLHISTSLGASSSRVIGMFPFTGLVERVNYIATATSNPSLQISSSVGALHDSTTITASTTVFAGTNPYSSSVTRNSVSQNMPIILANTRASSGVVDCSVQITLLRTIDQEVLV